MRMSLRGAQRSIVISTERRNPKIPCGVYPERKDKIPPLRFTQGRNDRERRARNDKVRDRNNSLGVKDEDEFKE